MFYFLWFLLFVFSNVYLVSIWKKNRITGENSFARETPYVYLLGTQKNENYVSMLALSQSKGGKKVWTN